MKDAYDYPHQEMIFGIDLDQPYHLDNNPISPHDGKDYTTWEFTPPPFNLYDQVDDLSNWINDPDLINDSSASPSSPINIPLSIPSPADTDNTSSSSFYSTFSPATFAALHPLPRSISPVQFETEFGAGGYTRQRVMSDMAVTPSWAHIWDAQPTSTSPPTSSSSALRTGASRPSIRHSPLTHTHSHSYSHHTHGHTHTHSHPISSSSSSSSYCPDPTATLRQRVPSISTTSTANRRGSLSLSSGHLFHSASAPTDSTMAINLSSMSRGFATNNNNSGANRRADSISWEDREATVRRKKRGGDEEYSPTVAPTTSNTASTNGTGKTDSPLKSVLRPPKLAPSAWQLYFTDWIQKQQASGTRKLNVAQAAKEAGQEYACLSTAEKEPYKRRSQSMKETREKEHEAYMRTLTPEDIKRENLFRAAQRKAGKSRKSNIKDPNAPKKPLSAYFMFLQRIRANPRLVGEIFGEETETTKQSVLAAAKWRSMSDAERQPFLAQAEQEKMEYEAARRLYEEGTTGFGSSINFSILPGSPHFPIVKMESESESESGGFMTDDGVMGGMGV